MAGSSISSDSKPLRRLLPGNSGQTPSMPPESSSRTGPKTAACDECRKQKSKCSRDRPTCIRCSRHRTRCHYSGEPGETTSQALKRSFDDLRTQADAYKEIVRLLRDLPADEARNILQRIRSSQDITTILDQAKVGNLLLQLATVPESRFRYELPYNSELPEDHYSDNPYLESLVYETATAYSPNRASDAARQNNSNDIGSIFNPSSYQCLYLKPFHAARVFNPLLSTVKPSSWTSVCSDDALMRDLLGEYFRCEFNLTAIFHIDLFLQDMADGRNDFCSSVLVNIVLACCCVCYPRFHHRAEYWNPHTLLYRFVAEAKRIWELESAEAHLTSIQAAVLFNVFHNLSGLDDVGHRYRVQALDLAQKLHLFDQIGSESQSRIRQGKIFTAWALYNWETLLSFTFMQSPLLKKPPIEPLPDPREDSTWYGEIWLEYPINPNPLPSYFGQNIASRTQFRIIMNDFCQEAYSQGPALTLSKVSELFSRLRSWYDDLPGPLTPKRIVLPAHLQLHICYQNLILKFYEPLLVVDTNQSSFYQQIVTDAIKRIQTLVRIYYLRHGFDYTDVFLVVPFTLVGFQCIDAMNLEQPGPKLQYLRSLLMLIAKGLRSQRRSYYIAEALFRVIRGRMRQEEALILKNILHLTGDESDESITQMQTVRSHWPVGVIRREEDRDANMLTNLVKRYAHLNVAS